MKKVLLVSPLPPPVGGIATWTKQILGSSDRMLQEGVNLKHYNYNLKNRKITKLNLYSRITSGIKDLVFHI